MLPDGLLHLYFLRVALFGVEFSAQAVQLLGILGGLVTLTGYALASGEIC